MLFSQMYERIKILFPFYINPSTFWPYILLCIGPMIKHKKARLVWELFFFQSCHYYVTLFATLVNSKVMHKNEQSHLNKLIEKTLWQARFLVIDQLVITSQYI